MNKNKVIKNKSKNIDQKVFILIGRSGCGKGTQGVLISDYLKKINPERKTLYVQTGHEFREFIKGDYYMQKLSRDINKVGGLQPEFISIYLWTNFLIREYHGNEHLIFDGTPRRRHEGEVLDSVLSFYNLLDLFVIHIDVSEKWATEKLMARHREDDKKDDIKKRLAWFKEDVMPAIEYYKNNPKYKYINVNGERRIEEIHEDIIRKIVLVK